MTDEHAWEQIKQQHPLSADVIDMAKALRMNPRKFRVPTSYQQASWKIRLSEFKRFGKAT